MNSKKEILPPRWAERLLEWYCRPELLEDLQGDLNEYFERNVKSKGARSAKLIYFIDVIKFFRPYTIRKPEFVNLLINWIMLGSYIKTSGRNIVRNKLFSAINIVGLSISMAVGLLIIGLLSDIFSYDQFNKNHSRIYRVITMYEYLGKRDGNYMATTSLKAAMTIKETFSQPEHVVAFHHGFEGDVKIGEKAIPLHGYWTSESLFDVFSFELLKGDPNTALKNPFSIVLTEISAKKLFGDQEALSKTVVLNNDKEYTITGIMKDVPKFSHLQFDMLGSLSTLPVISKDKGDMAWDNIWGTWVYLLLPPDADLKNLKRSFDQLSVREDSTVKNTHIELDLQPMDKIMLGQDLGNQIGPVLGKSGPWIFGGLAFVVVLSACFNYTNLSIARSLRRTREVGIRKVIGALKSQVISQFVVEAVLISLSSLAVALGLFFILKPYFLNIEESIQRLLTLELTPTLFLYFLVFAIVVGLSAGIFPALFFSRINAVQALKNFSAGIGSRRLTMRKVLIVFQYCISIMFITSTVLIFRQYKHFVTFDLGFKTDNILNIALQGNKAELLKKELNELPEVKNISQSVMITSVGNYWGSYMKYPANPNDSAQVYYNTVDENYIPLHEHKLIAGRNFLVKADSTETEVIVNQQVLKRFNIAGQNPAKALDEVVKVDHKEMRIVGVMKDFHYGRANGRNMQKEVILRYSKKDVRLLNVKLESKDLLTTYAKIEAIWKRLDPVHPFEAKFYSEQIENAFAGLKASVKMAGFLAVLAICIASMGLLGMVVFTTEMRVKEISIRKVMGATETGLMYILGRGFFILLMIAACIALPATYLFFEQFLFPEIANHAPISMGDLFVGVLAIFSVAIVMIASQTLKVARTNPAEVLKAE